MARILTGIQSTGTPHLGNLLGAIRPAIDLAHQSENESFLFIADMHSLTQVKDGATLRETPTRWPLPGSRLASTPSERSSTAKAMSRK